MCHSRIGEWRSICSTPENMHRRIPGKHILYQRLVHRRCSLAVPDQPFAGPAIRIIVPSSAGHANVTKYDDLAVPSDIACRPIASAPLAAGIIYDIADLISRVVLTFNERCHSGLSPKLQAPQGSVSSTGAPLNAIRA